MPFPVERFEEHANDAAVAALRFHQQGFNVLPCRPREKRTKVRWKRWQVEPQRRTDVNALFDGHEGNVGIICGQGSGNLCALDIEDKSLFEEFAIEFERVCGLTWMVITARGGHIYCLTDSPVKPQKGHLFEIRGQGQYILGPGSIHSSGVLYEYRSKPDYIARVTTLPFCELQYVEPQSLRAARRSRVWDILNRYQGRVGSYPSLSEFDQALIQACVNVGEDLNQIRMVLRSAQCRTHYQRMSTERGPEAAEDFLGISYRTAIGLPNSTAAENAMAIAADVHSWAIGTSWPGRTGLSDKAVLLAHATRCEQAKHPEYHLSCRDGAEIAEVGHTTFTQATRRLMQFFCSRLKRLALISLSWPGTPIVT